MLEGSMNCNSFREEYPKYVVRDSTGKEIPDDLHGHLMRCRECGKWVMTADVPELVMDRAMLPPGLRKRAVRAVESLAHRVFGGDEDK